MKVCYKCNQKKSTTEFGKNASRKDGLQAQCRVCQATYRRRHYQKNKGKYIKKAKKWDEKYMEWYRILKHNKTCVDCQKSWPYYVMHFDHREPQNKQFSIGKAAVLKRSKKEILKEISKCDLVCANCHAERTWGEKSADMV